MNNDPRFDRLIAEGLAASQDNRSGAALELFAQASAVAPTSGIPHFLVGSEHASAGNIEAAEAAFANAVLLAPAFVLARYQLGLLQFSSQRVAVALITWQPLFSLPDTEPFGHFVRGFTALAHDQFAEALQHYRTGLSCNHSNPALSADIMRVMESVERLVGGPDPHATKPEDQASHVLLAGYSRRVH